MLEKILKLYTMAMAIGVRSPMPHLVGPPGCGKSTVVEMAARLIGVNLHVVNVSRISPLDLEGVQMPTGSGEEMLLKLLHATTWTQLKEGDILLFDEFLRGFPEVYNGLLDIFTSRKVADFELPEVFIIGASNSTIAYDKALEDRLLHLPVPDPRGRKTEQKNLAKIIVSELGLMPEMVNSMEMQSLLDTEVLPMYDILDAFNGKGSAPSSTKGRSLRNLIGQAQLREIQSPTLVELLKMNNMRAMQQSKAQFVFLAEAKQTAALPTYEAAARRLVGNDKLTPVQEMNINLNLKLIETEKIRHEKGTPDDEVVDAEPESPFFT